MLRAATRRVDYLGGNENGWGYQAWRSPLSEGALPILASLVLEAIYLRKEGLVPFIAARALLCIMGIAAAMRTTSVYFAPETSLGRQFGE